MKIVIDSREQVPFGFSGLEVDLERGTLPTGDYSVPGFTDRVAIERKSLEDLVFCLMGSNRDRFERELARGRAYELFAVVCEGSWQDLSAGAYRSEMRPKAVLQSIFAFMVRYQVNFILAGSRAAAEYITFSLLAKYMREIEERFKEASKAQVYKKDTAPGRAEARR